MSATLTDEQRTARYAAHMTHQLGTMTKILLEGMTVNDWRTAMIAGLHGADLGLRITSGADGLVGQIIAIRPDDEAVSLERIVIKPRSALPAPEQG